MTTGVHQPGCFGVGIACNPHALPCSKCSVLSECSEASLESLKKVHSKVDVSDLLRRHGAESSPPSGPTERMAARDTSKLTLTADQRALIGTMKKKPGDLARRLFEQGVCVKRLARGAPSPLLSKKYSFLNTAIRLLSQKGFTKAELKAALLLDHPHWVERTAEGQVSLIVSLLESLGAGQWREKRMILTKEGE